MYAPFSAQRLKNLRGGWHVNVIRFAGVFFDFLAFPLTRKFCACSKLAVFMSGLLFDAKGI